MPLWTNITTWNKSPQEINVEKSEGVEIKAEISQERSRQKSKINAVIKMKMGGTHSEKGH